MSKYKCRNVNECFNSWKRLCSYHTVSIYSAVTSYLLISSLTTDQFAGRHPYNIQQSTGITVGEECKHVERPTQSFRRVRESACFSSQSFSFPATVCVWACACVSRLFYAPLLVFTKADTVRLDFTKTLMAKGTTRIPARKYQQLGLAGRRFSCHATQLLSSQTMVSYL